MSNYMYLKMTGEQQGLISAGCGTVESISHLHQPKHQNEIFVLNLMGGISNHKNVNHHGITFAKLIDKSTPLLAQGISNNERYFLEFYLYRINPFGKWERYFYIELRGATISIIASKFKTGCDDIEEVSVSYDYIRCRHLISSTEYYHFVLPADYNSLFSVKNPIVAAQNAAKRAVIATPQPVVERGVVDAGFCVVHSPSTVREYGQWLFREPPEGAQDLYHSLNGDGQLKAGAMLLIVDPKNQNSEQITALKKAKLRVDAALSDLTDDEANFLHKHYAAIANFSNIAEAGVGLAADSAGKYFEHIEKILHKIHLTYKNQYLMRGTLIGEQFFVERRQLFKELDTIIKTGFLGKSLKLGEYTKIKNALGLSSSSIMHNWSKNGVGDIEGYATHIERSAKLVKSMRYTGYAAIGFSALHSINEINEACSVGREDECSLKKYTEVGRFSLGTAAGIFGGAAGMWGCSLVLGPVTLGSGVLMCGLIVGGAMGYAGGEVGGILGEKIGDKIYQVIEK